MSTYGTPASGEFAKCQQCDWTGRAENMRTDSPDEIEGFFERVQPGEEMPSGECPECGALCHPADCFGNYLSDKRAAPNPAPETNAPPAVVDALKLAEATIKRLSTNHGPFNSAQGTLDVIAAALAGVRSSTDQAPSTAPRR